MSKAYYEFTCPNCKNSLTLEQVQTWAPLEVKTICNQCYFPLRFYPERGEADIRIEYIRKTAFLIHSAKKEEKNLLDWFRYVVGLYGVSTHIIEEDPRSQPDWLQKSLDGIRSSQFIFVLLTKRCQYTDPESELLKWKAPDKCYDEIAMAFALGTMLGGRDIFALVEKGVDPGRVLEARAWYYILDREYEPFQVEIEFFHKIDAYMGNV